MVEKTTEPMKNLAIFTCPNCEELDKEVSYEVGTISTEYGSASMPIEDNSIGHYPDYDSHEYGDSEWGDDLTFSCNACAHQMERSEMMAAFTAHRVTVADYGIYLKNIITLEELISASTTKKIKTTRPQKPAHGAETIIYRKESNELVIGFKNFGAECPRCHAIFAKDKNDDSMEFMCTECEHEFDISSSIKQLTESPCKK